MQEIWKDIDIEEFKGIYQVSNLGRVRSVDRIIILKKENRKDETQKRKGIILKGTFSKQNPYINVKFRNVDIRKSFRVHRLVAEAFIPNPDNKSEVNHKDGNPKNNHIDNLEWVTRLENQHHAINTGLIGKENNSKWGKIGSEHSKKYQSKKVGKYLNGELIETYYSIREAVRQNGYTARASIILCCKGKHKHAYGFQWRFLD